MIRVQGKFVLTVAVVLLIVCSSWGFLMHRTMIQLSVYQLPAEMQPFFHQNMEELVRNSVRPDQRRNKVKSEDTKHFIDFEAYGKNASTQMPTKWKAAVNRYSEDSLLKYGYVPYWVVEMQKRLTAAFRKGNKDSILFYAIDLAHYIHDAHVPLHTTLNYDGQLTNQKGLHSLWESMIPELTLKEFDLRGAAKATYLKSPEKAIWKAVRQAHSLVPNLLKTERSVSRQFTDSTKYRIQNRNGKESRNYTSAFGRAYAKALEPTVNRQAIAATNLVADFWYTAWVDAGKPGLKNLLTKKWSKANAAQLQKEMEAYRRNELLKKGLLQAKE